MSEITPQEVQTRIPHRHPFLFVDSAKDYVEGESLTGILNLDDHHPVFAGHFPGNPIFPGVLIIEALAQTGALLMSKSLDVDISTTLILFMGVEKARFRSPALPGACLALKTRLIFARSSIYKFSGEAYIDDQLAADVNFVAKKVTIQAITRKPAPVIV